MDRSISAADANRNFSSLLRDVRDGETFRVTSHGKPVARIIPADQDQAVTSVARELLFKRLKAQPALNVGSWSRDELYDDEV